MALVKCADCGKDISTSAPACPHCGRPSLARQNSTNLGDMLKGCAGLVVGLFGLLVCLIALKACASGG